MSDIVESLLWRRTDGTLINPLGPEAADRIEKLEKALRAVAALDVPRPIGHTFRQDGVASKNDKCWHGEPMYEECAPCIAAYARATLEERS